MLRGGAFTVPLRIGTSQQGAASSEVAGSLGGLTLADAKECLFFGDRSVPTTLPARRRVRPKVRLASMMWFLASFALAVVTIWIALAYLL